MADPRGTGFTGRVWEAVPADQLARDLETGPGSAPMAQAGQAWVRLAAGLGEAVVEYEQIIGALRQAWRSTGNEVDLQRLSTLGRWLGEAAAAATSNAMKAEAQAAAYEIARLAMPNSGEIAIAEALKNTLQHGHALGGPLMGVAADVEDKSDIGKAQAARVMQEYEKATTILANPWEQEHPPTLTSGTALAAETAAMQRTTPHPAASAYPAMSRYLPGATAFPRAKTAYRTENIVESATREPVVTRTAVPTPTVVTPAAAPIAPVGAMGMAGADEQEHTVASGAGVAADATEPDRIGLDVGYTAAPAVLGGQASTPRPRHLDAPEPS